jgi:hypothetical protein
MPAHRRPIRRAAIESKGLYKEALIATIQMIGGDFTADHIDFPRHFLLEQAKKRNIGNPADIVHRFKGRGALPEELVAMGFAGLEAIDRDTLRLVRYSPNIALPTKLSKPLLVRNLVPTSVWEAGFPRDEQALMAITRYSRLVAFLLGLQDCNHVVTHWKTRLVDGTQVEIDDFYLGSEPTRGRQVAVPVEAKLRADQIQAGQIVGGSRLARERYPSAQVVPVAFAYLDATKTMVLALQFGESDQAKDLTPVKHAVYSFIESGPPPLAPGTPRGEPGEQES